MRKIEKQMIDNLGTHWQSGNTRINSDGQVYLHGNLISELRDGVRWYTLAGWPTPTTRSRLNALGANVSQRDGLQYVINMETRKPLCEIAPFDWFAVTGCVA